jgi:hypothetical protein
MESVDPLEPLARLNPVTVVAVVGAAAALTGLVMLWRWDRRRRMRNARNAAVTRCGFDALKDVLVPDGQGGSLHIDFLLLTPRGIIVIDLRDIAGNIFGGDQMTEWTVMHRAQRITFTNPQPALYDRIAAVRALCELPVEGRVVFSSRGQFPKGLPRHTLMLDSLAAEFPSSDRQAMASLLERWMPEWERVRKAISPSRMVAPKSAV